MNIDDLLNFAFIDPNGPINKMYAKYEGYVNAMGKPINKSVIGCEYVKRLFTVEHVEKDKPLSYYKEVSEMRLENWIRENYKK